MLWRAQSPGEQVGTADGAHHEPPDWPFHGLSWSMRGFENTLKSRKKSGFGMFITTGWIQPLLGICSQQFSPKAVYLVLSLAGGSPPSALGGWWSCISMVIFSCC